jgi:5'-phosphate synthase pdxT subunit
MIIGVLDIQGDVSEHMDMVKASGEAPKRVRRVDDMKDISGLIIPGGESTMIGPYMKLRGIDKYIIEKNIPIMGTCAGLIVTSKEVIGGNTYIPLFKIKVSRNAYGRQRESFETDIDIKGIGNFRGVFIRAPIIEEVYSGDILSYYNGKPVMVKDGKNLGMTFHPEIYGDPRIHQLFINGL